MLKKFGKFINENSSEVKINIEGFRIVESMEYNGDFYFRIDDSEEGIEWYEDGNQGIYEYRLSSINPELCDELETYYEESGKGYSKIFGNQ